MFQNSLEDGRLKYSTLRFDLMGFAISGQEIMPACKFLWPRSSFLVLMLGSEQDFRKVRWARNRASLCASKIFASSKESASFLVRALRMGKKKFAVYLI